jgi:hypothetical protein
LHIISFAPNRPPEINTFIRSMDESNRCYICIYFVRITWGAESGWQMQITMSWSCRAWIPIEVLVVIGQWFLVLVHGLVLIVIDKWFLVLLHSFASHVLKAWSTYQFDQLCLGAYVWTLCDLGDKAYIYSRLGSPFLLWNTAFDTN